MILNKEFETRKEIEECFIELWNLPRKDDNFDRNFLLNKKIRFKEEDFVVESYFKKVVRGKEYFRLQTKEGKIINEFSANLIILNPITKVEEVVPIQLLFKNGYYCSQKIFKGLYYRTEEYRKKLEVSLIQNHGEDYKKKLQEKIQNSMFDKYGVRSFLSRGKHYEKINDVMIKRYGVTVPMKNEVIKNKISSTMKERYGVPWFLSKGENYDKTIQKIIFEKHGYESRIEGLFKRPHSQSVSKQEKSFIDWLVNYFDLKNFYSYLNSQKKIKFLTEQVENRVFFFLDFYDFENNIVIEYFGDLWHANPTLFDEKFVNPVTKETAKEIWETDRKKRVETIKQLNCEYIVVWENDWKRNKEVVIKYLEYVYKNKKNRENTIQR